MPCMTIEKGEGRPSPFFFALGRNWLQRNATYLAAPCQARG